MRWILILESNNTKMRKGFFITENEDDIQRKMKRKSLITGLSIALITLLGAFSLAMMIIQLESVFSAADFNVIIYSI